ncbi:MAG: glycine cleavage system protein GcvH [bacterium]|nr:glycine cleavage system protein GcvH [bacterium]
MGKLYSKSHEWVEKIEDIYVVGITKHAAKELGDVVYIEMPAVGDTLEFGKSFGVVESVKSVSDLISPLNGEIKEINEELDVQPELINQDAEAAGWIMKVTVPDEAVLAQLISESEYSQFISEE